MIGVLQLTLVLDEAALFLACVTLVLRPRATGWLFPGALALQVLVLVQAAAGLAWLSGDHGLPRPGLLAAYLVASTLLLPVAGALVRRADARLAAARLGAACALALVLQVRLAGIWAERAG